jgi:S-adenosylmethionine:tRNA ribosyltransferase-isomerase
MLELSDFDYNLPGELIAQYPLKDRTAARLLVLKRKDGVIEHSVFKNIKDYLRPDDLLVLNNTKVLPARLLGCRISGGKVEVLILAKKESMTFRAMIRPQRLKLGEKIIFNNGKIYAQLISKNEIKFFAKGINEIYSHGVMPLPPYIRRKVEEQDNLDYQTVYAQKDGSIASPTAGLHFSRKLLGNIKSDGTNIAYITLHIGYSTFKPVKVDDITKHKMEPEYFKIPPASLKLINNSRAKGKRVIAVGTTSLRALETYALACAFAGEKLLKRAYQEAIEKNYRFYSYGDAMLII